MNTLLIKLLRPLLDLLEHYRWWLFGIIYFFAVGVYYFVCKVDGLVSFYQAFALFAMSIAPIEGAGNCNTWVYIAGILAALYTMTSVISLVAKRFIDKESVNESTKSAYILVCGLGKKASAYIDSERLEDKDVNIVVIEKDAQNPNIEKYRALGIAVKVADASSEEVLRELHIKKAKHIVALAGKDVRNLEIALSLSAVTKEQNLEVKKLYMHIDDRGLDKFYKDGGLLDDNAKLEVKMFSMSRNGAKALFLEHAVDGAGREYMDSSKPLSLLVAGHSKLAIEVIGQICELAHLPNENEVTIYCVDEDAEAFQKAVAFRYPNIGMVPNIRLEYVSLCFDTKAFYEDALWQNKMTNIMLCYDDAQTNLDIASELADSTYLHEIDAKTLASKIHIAIYDNAKIADNINGNQEHFKYFDVFAQTAFMASKEMVVDEKFELIAKCIHAGYEMRYNSDAMFSEDKAIQKAWNKTAKIADRISNRAQAYHIPTKLKAMGLGYKDSEQNTAERLLHNKEMFAHKPLEDDLKALKLDRDNMLERTKQLVGDNQWSTESFEYFPKKYDLLMEKLLRAEHNRWNAHHWLKGWEHDKVKNPKLKQHDCLVPLDALPDAKRHTIIYDIYSILYIPNLLTKAGYELVELNDV